MKMVFLLIASLIILICGSFLICGCVKRSNNKNNTKNVEKSNNKDSDISSEISGIAEEYPATYGDKRDGFRGIPWGTDISNLPYMIQDEDEVYVRKNEKMKIGDIDISSIKYKTHLGKLIGVYVLAKNFYPSDNNLARAVSAAYGIPMRDDGTAFYEGSNVKISAWKGSFRIECVSMVKEKERYTEEKQKEDAEKAKVDF